LALLSYQATLCDRPKKQSLNFFGEKGGNPVLDTKGEIDLMVVYNSFLVNHYQLVDNRLLLTDCVTFVLSWHYFKSSWLRPHQFNSLDSRGAEPHPGGQRKIKRVIFFKIENSLLDHFIHFQLHNNAPICLQIPSKVKVTLGKSCCFLPFVLKYLMPHFYFYFLPPNLGKSARLPAIQLNKLVWTYRQDRSQMQF
jgi:hypothetical protein